MNSDDAGWDATSEEMMSWERFSGRRSIFDKLLDINEFAVVAEIPPIPEVGEGGFAQELSSKVYPHVLSAIEKARFFNQSDLALSGMPGRAGVVYQDDRYDFKVEIGNDTILVRRDGSRMEDFHYWFLKFGDPLSALIAGCLDELKNLTGREFTIFRASFYFKFIVHSLYAEGSKRRIRNSEVMRKLVKGLPNDSGQLSDEEEVFDTAGRIDVNISRWVRTSDQLLRLERYTVEAPANKEFAGLWFTFGYGGETYKSPNSRDREPFEHRKFFGEYEVAYGRFLRDKAILSFMSQIMSGIDFRSSASVLP
ncbi:hypothetical protein GCM10010169_15480 [Micromonospora fulviviridis]|uniref:hypothetical protein n=1 Tax=Micromonospora fulviviridis TaxID=47860 RepID=UPI001662DB22|nr:hypothetical protein [Micromonospora fulviviridis]GGR72424.1 hypothetical protein GCM10010169_15480 [Micromonospora fulviviridis]